MSSRSKSTKVTENTSIGFSSNFENSNNNTQIAGENNTVFTTDFGAVQASFAAFGELIESNDKTIEAIKGTVDKTSSAIKDFATTISSGDQISAQYIALAVIVAVVISVVAFVYFR